MLEVTKVKMSGTKKKVNRKTYNISSMKPVTRKFLEGSRCSQAKKKKKKKQQRNVQKTVLHVQSCFFFLLLIVVYFTLLIIFTRFFSNTRFYILFE